jgi:hypothetical protein
MGTTSLHTHGCRVSDEWQIRGLRAAVLENELVRVTVLLDRGAEIVELRHKPTDIDPLLRLPVPIHDPARSIMSIAGGVGSYMDMYLGGWQEIAPSGGPSNTHQGVEYGQHGEVSLLPWQSVVLEDTPERVTLRCTVRGVRSPIRIERDMTIERGRAALLLRETMYNDAGEAFDTMWGHHIAYGLPFLQHGARIHTSAAQVLTHDVMPGFTPRRAQVDITAPWPVVPGADGQPLDLSVVPAVAEAQGRELAYLTDYPDAAWYTVYSDAHHLGVAVTWDAQVFRHVWLWQELAWAKGFPWWGRSYAVALEPWSSYPSSGLAEAVAKGTQLTISAHGRVDTFLTVALYQDERTPVQVHADGTLDFASL